MNKAYCAACGRELKQTEGAAFCPYCGAPAHLKEMSGQYESVRIQELKTERARLYASCFSALVVGALMAMNVYFAYRIFTEHEDGMILLLGLVLPVLDVPLMYVLYRATRRDDKGILDILL